MLKMWNQNISYQIFSKTLIVTYNQTFYYLLYAVLTSQCLSLQFSQTQQPLFLPLTDHVLVYIDYYLQSIVQTLPSYIKFIYIFLDKGKTGMVK